MERGCKCLLPLVGPQDKADESDILGGNNVFYFYVFVWNRLMDSVDGWVEDCLVGGEGGAFSGIA